MTHAAIIGLSGPSLTAEEDALLRACPPVGVILFARNVIDPPQLRALIAAIREAAPHALLGVDQEGGRVARLRPPHWRAHPAAGTIGALPPAAARRAAWITGALIGWDCRAAGFDLVCAPVLDLRIDGAHDVVGDRAFGADPDQVAALGRAMADGLLAAGVQPVAKHAPGHGQALLDTHLSLPTVDAGIEADLAPFRALRDLPWMMTAHIVYARVDAARPGTLSPTVIAEVIRGRIGFEGALVSDDLNMGALDGDPGDRAAAAIAAGCDVALHCSGMLADSEAVLRAAGPLRSASARRIAAARAMAANRRIPLDPDALEAERDALL